MLRLIVMMMKGVEVPARTPPCAGRYPLAEWALNNLNFYDASWLLGAVLK